MKFCSLVIFTLVSTFFTASSVRADLKRLDALSKLDPKWVQEFGIEVPRNGQGRLCQISKMERALLVTVAKGQLEQDVLSSVKKGIRKSWESIDHFLGFSRSGDISPKRVTAALRILVNMGSRNEKWSKCGNLARIASFWNNGHALLVHLIYMYFDDLIASQPYMQKYLERRLIELKEQKPESEVIPFEKLDEEVWLGVEGKWVHHKRGWKKAVRVESVVSMKDILPEDIRHQLHYEVDNYSDLTRVMTEGRSQTISTPIYMYSVGPSKMERTFAKFVDDCFAGRTMKQQTLGHESAINQILSGCPTTADPVAFYYYVSQSPKRAKPKLLEFLGHDPSAEETVFLQFVMGHEFTIKDELKMASLIVGSDQLDSYTSKALFSLLFRKWEQTGIYAGESDF